VSITCEGHSNHILITRLTIEAFRVKICSCDSDRFSFDNFVTFAANFNLVLIIFFAENLIIEGVVGAINFFFTYTASLLTFLVVLLTYGLVHESEVLALQWISANVAGDASGVVIFLVGYHTIPRDVVLADAALLLGYLVALGTVWLFVFCEEFPIQLFPAVLALEAFLVIDLPESCAPVLCERLPAPIAVSCRFVHHLDGSVSNSSFHIRIIQVHRWISRLLGDVAFILRLGPLDSCLEGDALGEGEALGESDLPGVWLGDVVSSFGVILPYTLGDLDLGLALGVFNVLGRTEAWTLGDLDLALTLGVFNVLGRTVTWE